MKLKLLHISIILFVVLLITGCKQEKPWDPFADGKIKFVNVKVNDSTYTILDYGIYLNNLYYSPSLSESELGFSCRVAEGNLEFQISNGSWQTNAKRDYIIPQIYDVKKNGGNARCSLSLCDLANASFKTKGKEYKTRDIDEGNVTITSFTSLEDYTYEVSGSFNFTVYDELQTDSIQITGDFDKLINKRL